MLCVQDGQSLSDDTPEHLLSSMLPETFEEEATLLAPDIACEEHLCLPYPLNPEEHQRPTVSFTPKQLGKVTSQVSSDQHMQGLPSPSPISKQTDCWSSSEDRCSSKSQSVGNNLTYEEESCLQQADIPSAGEQKIKYRTSIMKIREQRRQGFGEKHLDEIRYLGSPGTHSSSSLKTCPGFSSTSSRTDCEDGLDMESPNLLSERMVGCMGNIYCHLSDANATFSKGSSSHSIHSPTSPFGHLTSSSLSSLSESSLLSFTRSPLVDLRNKEEVIGTDASPDPFKARGKLPWADIGVYRQAVEVPQLSVGKEQLDYAAQALRKFKLLVEQLSRVEISFMSHNEKLAFWINVYNALLMHAFLAYGIPRSDLKFFSLMQKAAYTVGRQSVNAATMEYCLLKGKSAAHRPQITLLMALHKNKLTEELNKFAIDHVEPLVNFALCCGTRSSPMVRIYTPDHVHEQLECAVQDYTRASVGISAKGKLLVPRLLYSYAHDLVDDNSLLDWVCNLLPSPQVAVIFDCIQQRRHQIISSRNFSVVPFDFTFRYLFSADISRRFLLL